MKKIKQIASSIYNFIVNFYHLYHHSIRYKIIILVTLTVLLPISLFGAYLYTFISDSIVTQNINKQLNQSIEQVNSSLLSKFRIIENTFTLFLSNQVIQSNLENALPEKNTYYAKARTRLEIETQLKYSVLNDYAWNSHLLKSVFIFQNNEDFYYLLENYLPNDDIVKDHLQFIHASKDQFDKKVIITPSSSYEAIYFMKDIKTWITKDSIGKIIFSIDETTFTDIYNNIADSPNWQAYIFDDEGTIYFHPARNKIGKKIDRKFIPTEESNPIRELLIDGEVYFVKAKRIDDIGMTSLIMIPKNEITAKLDDLISKYLYTIIFIALLTIIISMFVVTNITKPIKDLIENIEEINDGVFTTKMPSYQYSEFDEVSTTFNHMVDKIQYLINEVYEKQMLLTESELKALQAQINPHFLFNVLETISWEARLSNNENIYRMVNSLGELLRANFSFHSREKIKIRQEIEYIEFYLYLQKIRFDDKLMINISQSDLSILDFYLPKLCIQPIVENAIIHGIENKIGKGHLSLTIKNEHDGLYFEIIDDGVGFDTSHVDIDNIKNPEYVKTKRKHIGLVNVNKRIKLIYGEPYGISIQSQINEGTKVIIHIPLDRGEV
ncbi:cache domain-containing sensor histidine kinase [Marinisporobacter balticus]|uniref:Two-component system sensor histidine kinase YesM n=1 Tax=Marinisporobacter balticus TaxID=2018667 RepID=A0A4R2KWL9_9FIRM|nr:histidine kinase [Marinisporobacter balticus]TCO77412.1 two-component system sensor histidine kinase YesM [Marinisporobacter balticus]